MKPLPQSLVTEKFTLAWGKLALVEELVPETTGVGVATGVGVGTGVATGVGVGVAEGVATGVGDGFGDGVAVGEGKGVADGVGVGVGTTTGAATTVRFKVLVPDPAELEALSEIEAAAAVVGVPEITPLVALTVRPDGRPVAA